MTTTLTVGAALALPEVQRGKAVVEFFAHGSVGQWSIVPRRERSCPRRWFSLRWWIPTDLKKACRVVPAADADKDPRTRGPIEGGSP